MAMNKKQEIQEALTKAMKSRDEDTKRTLRLVMSAIKLAEVEEGSELDENRILGILQREVKTREDVIKESKQADREDLVGAAEREKKILESFLPKQLNEAELIKLAKDVITDTNASSMRDMGKVMKNLLPILEGRASGQKASNIVRKLLQNK